MSILAGILANALLFSSLLLVVGVPVFYMTQDSPEDNRNSNIRKNRSSWRCVFCIGITEWIGMRNRSRFCWLTSQSIYTKNSFLEHHSSYF